MQKRISRAAKYFLIAAILLVVAFVALIFSFQPKPPPPLPFDTNQFVHTTSLGELILSQPPPNQTLLQRIGFGVFKMELKLRKDKTFTDIFPPSAKSHESVQVLLKDCMNASGTRYWMSAETACGVLVFGHTNTLDGPHFVAAVESALERGDVGWWHKSSKKWQTEPLVLLRFPKQEAILVLPKSEVPDFLKTNKLDPNRFQDNQ